MRSGQPCGGHRGRRDNVSERPLLLLSEDLSAWVTVVHLAEGVCSQLAIN